MDEELYLVGNSHIDLSWLWTKSETITEVCPKTFNPVLKLLNDYPFLRFSQSSAQLYEWVEKYHPEMYEQIKDRIRDGRSMERLKIHIRDLRLLATKEEVPL